MSQKCVSFSPERYIVLECPPKKKSKSDDTVYTSASDYMGKKLYYRTLYHLKEGYAIMQSSKMAFKK